jgi:hypothetical protein
MYKPATNTKSMFKKWNFSLFLSIIGLILFFIYFTSSVSLIGYQQTINLNDGSPIMVISSNAYIEAISYLNVVGILLVLNFGLTFAQVISEFQVLGRGRFKRQ